MFEKNEETVKIAYKHLPLRSHNLARPAALASLAANEQGKFWEYHDKLFAEKTIVAASIDKIATEIGLDQDQFKKDMGSSRLNRFPRLKPGFLRSQLLAELTKRYHVANSR